MIPSRFNNNLEKFHNCHKGQIAILFATGSSVRKYKDFPDSATAIKFGLNTIYNIPDIATQLQYYYYGSGYYHNQNHRKNVDKMCAREDLVTFASAYENGVSHGIIKRGNISPEDALLLRSNPFENNLSAFTNDIAKYSTMGHSIVFPAIQHILYMGFSKVYLVGCDAGSEKSSDTDLLALWTKFSIFKNKYYPDVDIISVNPVCLTDMFRYIRT